MLFNCVVTFLSVALNVLIFSCTYAAVVCATTMSASLFAASATFFPCPPVTVSEMIGCVRAAQEHDVQHAGQSDVSHVAPAPGEQPGVFLA